MSEPIPEGLYETLITEQLEAQLLSLAGDRTVQRENPVEEEAVSTLVRAASSQLAAALRTVPQVEERVAICNEILEFLSRRIGGPSDRFAVPLEQLLAVLPPEDELAEQPRYVRPLTPLSTNRLMVNGSEEPSLQQEIARELESADGVDLICAFVRFPGVVLLKEPLRRLTVRGAPLRVLTTTYIGATQRKAVDLLVELGAEVKIAYDHQRTRLHAKAWLFRRDTGFATAYVGSSNLSRSALLDGLEWNVRLSTVESPAVFDTFRSTFESYWLDPHFESYDPARDAARLDAELGANRDDKSVGPRVLFDIRPYPFQEQILEQLDVERERHGRWHNLVVAATGTGKTVVAAFDYRRLREQFGDLSLLFVAHRKEILEQSLEQFRGVLRDPNFGELFVGGIRPSEGKHVFASVQSLANVDLASIPPDRFGMVIVDEFHRAAAPTYERLLNHFTPKVLLGLTATPERMDGRDVSVWFGKRFATELRLWDALAQQLLSPFHYFGLHDGTDLQQVEWKRGGYELAQLDALYTGNDRRVQLVLDRLHEHVAEPGRMRALGFCVSVWHAEYMALRFTEAGFNAVAVTGKTPEHDRDAALTALEAGDVQIVFSVDVLNEGVDVPSVDTVLMLRPTESATVFLQQLGRGLRLASGKSHLTVLDFIGQQHREFRFDLRYRALTGGSRREVAQNIEEGFPFLPAGCNLELDRIAQEIILSNVRNSLRSSRRTLVDELRRLEDTSLTAFLAETGFELEDIYTGNGHWTLLRRAAGHDVPPEGPHESALARAVGRMLHVDDPERLSAYRRFVAEGSDLDIDRLTQRAQRLLAMLRFALWGIKAGLSLSDSQARLSAHPAIQRELLELFDVLDDRARHVARPLDDLTDVPLGVHSRYSREEVLAALGQLEPEKPFSMQAGVFYDDVNKVDSLFVTVHKTEAHYSPTTMYRDYPLSARLFHWESQNNTALASKAGQRYLNHASLGTQVFLFVREHRVTSYGATQAYLFLGPVDYVSHEGERPIAITWRMRHPIPQDFLANTELVARGA
ncbi:MAG: DUF3427 domain-containing protein [Actinobacteria bacterium]|nr:DUF3427 domain-containing protein [Actinomycetota bacterium]